MKRKLLCLTAIIIKWYLIAIIIVQESYSVQTYKSKHKLLLYCSTVIYYFNMQQEK